MLSHFLETPAFPSLQNNLFFESRWASHVHSIISEDILETNSRYHLERELLSETGMEGKGRNNGILNSNLCRASEADEVVSPARQEQLATARVLDHLLKHYSDWWVPLKLGSMLHAGQLMVGATAILEQSYGRYWPTSCRLVLGTGNDQLCKLWEEIPKTDLPLMGFAIIGTASHWALVWSCAGRVLCFDGLKRVSSSLAEVGRLSLQALGVDASGVVGMVSGQWQEDSWSCGWWVLRCIETICQGYVPSAGSDMPALDPAGLMKRMNQSAAERGFRMTTIVIENEPDEPAPDSLALTNFPWWPRFDELSILAPLPSLQVLPPVPEETSAERLALANFPWWPCLDQPQLSEAKEKEAEASWLELDFLGSDIVSNKRGVGRRFEPPPPRVHPQEAAQPLAQLPLKAKPFLSKVIHDHLGEDVVTGSAAVPKFARIGQRADVESLTAFCDFLKSVGLNLPSILTWFTYMHLVPRREAVSTAIVFLRSEIRDRPQQDLSKEEFFVQVYELLQTCFQPGECDFDLNRPGIGGLRAYKALLPSWQKVRKYCDQVAQLPPASWRMSTLDALLPKTLKFLGKTSTSTYLRKHHVRAMACLAVWAGSASRPSVQGKDWRLMLTRMPGTGRAAAEHGLQRLVQARVACEHISQEVAKQSHQNWDPYDEYDLSCALCLAHGKPMYHKDSFLPFVPRLKLEPRGRGSISKLKNSLVKAQRQSRRTPGSASARSLRVVAAPKNSRQSRKREPEPACRIRPNLESSSRCPLQRTLTRATPHPLSCRRGWREKGETVEPCMKGRMAQSIGRGSSWNHILVLDLHASPEGDFFA